MSKIVYKNQNIVECDESIIAHGTNCQGVENPSGVFKYIKKAFPEAHKEYIRHCSSLSDSNSLLGKYSVAQSGERLIFNLNTQEYYGYDCKKYASYDALHNCLLSLNQHVASQTLVDRRIAMPKIGCGRGGLQWGVVCAMVEEYIDFPVTIYEITDNFTENTNA